MCSVSTELFLAPRHSITRFSVKHRTSNIEHPTSNFERFPCGRRGIFDALDSPSTSTRLPCLTELHLHSHGAAHHSTPPPLHHATDTNSCIRDHRPRRPRVRAGRRAAV